MKTYHPAHRAPLHLLSLAFVLSVAATTAHAQLLASFDGSTLTAGSAVTSWTDTVGGHDATAVSYSATVGGLPGGDPTAANANSVFNGHTYVDFGIAQGLQTASPLFSGNVARSVAAVYNTPSGSNGFINPIAGEVGPGVAGDWFVLQARTAPAGSPYLAGFAADTGTGTVPVANQLTFALGTYDGTTETLYWAVGVTGAIHSDSLTVSLNTGGGSPTPFEIGYDSDEGSLANMQIGTVQVFGNAMTLTQATTEIQALQAEYAVPEPATCAMMLAGLAFLGLCLRRKNALLK